MLLRAKPFIIMQDKASKENFFFLFHISKQFRPKNQSSKIEKCPTGRGWGVRKSAKKCHVMFE
jgi:hypothetical protein